MQGAGHYARELSLAMRIGAGAIDGLRLAAATALFHLGNARRTRRASPPVRYRVRLLGRVHDLWLRTFAGDLFVLYEVFLSGCYDVPGMDFARNRLIVDLGANVGIASLYFAARSPQARFVCVEPSPGNVQVLRRNLASVPNATVVEAAAAGESGSLPFDDDRPAWGGLLSPGGRRAVRCISMNDIWRDFAMGSRINLLKIDIEGAEREIFSADTGWLDHVDCVIAELHHPYTFEEFHTTLTRRGFVVYGSGENGYAMPTAIRRPPA